MKGICQTRINRNGIPIYQKMRQGDISPLDHLYLATGCSCTLRVVASLLPSIVKGPHRSPKTSQGESSSMSRGTQKRARGDRKPPANAMPYSTRMFHDVRDHLLSVRSKGGCVNLLLRFSPKCEQGGEGVQKAGKSAYVLNGWSLSFVLLTYAMGLVFGVEVMKLGDVGARGDFPLLE